MTTSRATRHVAALLLGLAALVVAGCELSTAATLEVQRDGSGRAGLTFHLDAALVDELDGLGIDPTAELTAIVAAEEDWTLQRRQRESGVEITVSRQADDPAALTEVLREVTAGLSAQDPAVEADLDLDVADDGSARLEGQVTMRAPAGPGVLDDPELDAEAMEDLVAEHVRAELQVTLPAPPERSDADHVDGSTLRWEVPVGEAVQVSASSPPPGVAVAEVGLVVGAVVLLGATVGGVLWGWRRKD